MADKKVVDDTYILSKKHGNGQLRREVWQSQSGQITRYNLAYINHEIYQGDNGRVVGYDNAHDGHHKHEMGVVTPTAFTSFEDIEDRFQQDWMRYRSKK